MPFVRDAMTREVEFVEPGVTARDAAMRIKKLGRVVKEISRCRSRRPRHRMGSLSSRG